MKSRIAAVGISGLTIIATLLPGFAAAAGPSITTQVLIPQGSAACLTPVLSGVVPYIYDNALNSFDVTISDPSYVAVLGSAGDTGIRLNYITRRVNPNGSLNIHVDLPTTPINVSLPVSLTLLSSPAGQPTCISLITFTVAGIPSTHPATGPSISTTPAASSGQTSTAHQTSSASSSNTVATSVPPVVGGGLQSALSRVCSAAGPSQLWFILLALFMVGIGLVAFAEPPLARKSAELPATLILVPLVLLLLFWYVTPECRVGVWVPIVLLVAAAVALLAAYREQTSAATAGKSPKGPLTPMKVAAPAKVTQTTTMITPQRAQQTTTTVTANKFEQTKTIITPPPKK